MKDTLPIFVALALASLPAMPCDVLAQEPMTVIDSGPRGISLPPDIVPLPAVGVAQPLNPPEPDDLFREAIVMLSRRQSIVAKVRHRAELYGRDVIGDGKYAQGPASSRLVRYELGLHVGDRNVHLLEINDGRHLWRRLQFKAEPDVERIDIDRVLAASQKHRMHVGADASMLLALGGVGKLLTMLDRDFDFAEMLPVGSLDSLPVYGLVGRWRPDALARSGLTSVSELRPHVPDMVVVYLGADDLFPYRIEYRRRTDGAGEGGSPENRLLLRLEFYEVEFDRPIDEALFRFAAEHVAFIDITDRIIAEAAAKSP